MTTPDRPAARAAPSLPSLTFLGHSTMLIEIAGTRILTDPLVFERLLILRRMASTPRPGAPPRPRRGPHLAPPRRPPPHPVAPPDRPGDAGDHAGRRRAPPDRARLHAGRGRPAGRHRAGRPGPGDGDVRRPRREPAAARADGAGARVRPRRGPDEGLLRRRHRRLPGDGRPGARTSTWRCSPCGAGAPASATAT